MRNKMKARQGKVYLLLVTGIFMWILATVIFNSNIYRLNLQQTSVVQCKEDPVVSDFPRLELLNALNLSKFFETPNTYMKFKKVQEMIRATWPSKAKPGDEGYGGKGVHINRSLLTEREKKIYDQGLATYKVNQMASDRISLRREISLDMPECKNVSYNTSSLPTAGVVLIFTDEMWSVLLRTVFSILDAGPEELITEVIIVDDASTKDHLGKPLDDYIRIFGGKVKVVRLPQRKGLITARLVGFDHVTGEVAVFLDSHCEVAKGWLEPLLHRVKQDKTVVAVPATDIINWETFEYEFQPNKRIQRCDFEFNMKYSWVYEPLPDGVNRKTLTDPIKTSTHLGCCFAVFKETFIRLGKYDPELELWGCENTELSLKTWMCGGRMEIIPCSHIGHMYRPAFPYSWPEQSYLFERNCLRVAEVWLDKYKVLYEDRILDIQDKINIGDLSERKALRKKLKCRSFDWFIKELNPGLYVPLNTTAAGRISSVAKPSLCMRKSTDWSQINKSVKSAVCTPENDQYFILTKERQIRRDDVCLGLNTDKNLLVAKVCDTDHTHWEYTQENILRNIESNRCIAMSGDKSEIKMVECNASDIRQQWMWPRKNILQ